MAFRGAVGQSEIIHHIWQHGPGLNAHKNKHEAMKRVSRDGHWELPLNAQSNSSSWQNFKLMRLPYFLTKPLEMLANHYVMPTLGSPI